jgi:hypothetical protein
MLIVLSAMSAADLRAGVRHFTFLYEAPTSPPGTIELENSVTWQHHSGANEVLMREELEIGITGQFQIGLYPLDWSHRSTDGLQYDGGAIELIYNLSNPVIDPVGISIYQEISTGRRHFESESKLIAQKNFGRWIVDYNATLEAEWEDHHLEEHEGEVQQALGASYEICPRLSVGIEFLHEFVFSDWRDDGNIRNVFIGPNASYRRNQWFVTATALAQPTGTTGEPNFELRTICGFGF